MLSKWNDWRPGVLNKKQIRALVEGKKLKDFDENGLDHSAIDLHINDIGHKMKGSLKPLKDDIPSIIGAHEDRSDTAHTPFKKDGKFYLKKGQTYIFQLKEHLYLEGTNISGQATGKSSFGRLDVLTRLLTNNSVSFDTVDQNYKGALWVEVTPITFPIIIKPGVSLNQLRLIKGEPRHCRINEQDLHLWGDLISKQDLHNSNEINQNNLTLNLDEDPVLREDICAFEAKEIGDEDESKYLDLTKNFDKEENKYDPHKYWDSVKNREDSLPIITEKFYILRSIERFNLPKSVAIYCQAVTENLGELRIHYAGFVHPLFGQGRKDGKGAPLIFEVRGHNIKTILRHGETLAKLDYFWMSEDAEDEKQSTYNDQELTLSKYFKNWGE
ncbi:MAG: dCTP deaminase [Acidobacteriota bacterium]|nr:dCTP deaminase [Acidobacteriota bacterium]